MAEPTQYSGVLIQRWYSRTLLVYALTCGVLGLTASIAGLQSSPNLLSHRLFTIYINVLVFGCASLVPAYFGWQLGAQVRTERVGVGLSWFGLALNVTGVFLLFGTLAYGRFSSGIAAYQELPMLSSPVPWLWGVAMLAAGLGSAMGALACYRIIHKRRSSVVHHDTHSELVSCACGNSILVIPVQLCVIGLAIATPHDPNWGLLLEHLYWLQVQPLTINVILPLVGLMCRWLETAEPSLKGQHRSIPHLGLAAATTSWFGWGVHVPAPAIGPMLTAACSAAFMLSLLASSILGLRVLLSAYTLMQTIAARAIPVAAASLLLIANALAQVPLAMPALRHSVLDAPYFSASWYWLAASAAVVFGVVPRAEPGTVSPQEQAFIPLSARTTRTLATVLGLSLILLALHGMIHSAITTDTPRGQHWGLRNQSQPSDV